MSEDEIREVVKDEMNRQAIITIALLMVSIVAMGFLADSLSKVIEQNRDIRARIESEVRDG